MTDSSHDFDDYVALNAEDRMKARLKGLAEVVSASGLAMLQDEDLAYADEALDMPPRVNAFGEDGAAFVGQVGQKIVINPAQIAALSTELGVSQARVADALDQIFPGLIVDRAP